jgi:hypothetical protein
VDLFSGKEETGCDRTLALIGARGTVISRLICKTNSGYP